MDGLRREDEACIRTAMAFVALAKHSRLLGSNADDDDGITNIAATQSKHKNDNKNDLSRRRNPRIALPAHLPRQTSLPLHPKQAHLLHLLHLAKQQKSSEQQHHQHPHELRVLCLHLVKQLSQKKPSERLEFFSNELSGIVSVTDDTVSPTRFPVLEHILSFGGQSLADELLPLVRNFLVKAESENGLAQWTFVAELTMAYVSLTPPAFWEPNGTAWCDLRSLARSFRRTNGLEVWRQHAFAHLSQLSMRLERQEEM